MGWNLPCYKSTRGITTQKMPGKPPKSTTCRCRVMLCPRFTLRLLSDAAGAGHSWHAAEPCTCAGLQDLGLLCPAGASCWTRVLRRRNSLCFKAEGQAGRGKSRRKCFWTRSLQEQGGREEKARKLCTEVSVQTVLLRFPKKHRWGNPELKSSMLFSFSPCQ